MIQFKPVVKTGSIMVMEGGGQIGSIVTNASGERVLKLVGSPQSRELTQADLVRLLRQTGVNVPVGIEDKIEAAVAQQQQVRSAGQAIRFARRKAPAEHKALVRSSKAVIRKAAAKKPARKRA